MKIFECHFDEMSGHTKLLFNAEFETQSSQHKNFVLAELLLKLESKLSSKITDTQVFSIIRKIKKEAKYSQRGRKKRF